MRAGSAGRCEIGEAVHQPPRRRSGSVRCQTKTVPATGEPVVFDGLTSGRLYRVTASGTYDAGDPVAVMAAIAKYSDSAWMKFQAQYGVTAFNLLADPDLGGAIFYKGGNAFDRKTVGELLALGVAYNADTPKAKLEALKDVFDWINNGRFLYQDLSW